MEISKRNVKICIISDTHLGTYGCHADILLDYLKSINPEVLILNGDIIDIWQFSKNYWPASHTKVLNYILELISKGVKVHYLTGNHDELLRKFSDFSLGNFSLSDKLIIQLPCGRKAWVFHGDVFDVTMKNSKWLAKLGGKGYDTLIIINRLLNQILENTGRNKISLSKKVKDSVKRAVKFISDFESTACDMAIYHGFDYVICGHIHQPKIREWKNESGAVIYLNSGDWVENCTALEFDGENWSLHSHDSFQCISNVDSENNSNVEMAEEFLPVLDLLKSVV